MRIKVGGPFATQLPDGTLDSPVPGSEITIDDADEALVAHWTMLCNAGHGEILEPAEVKHATIDPEAGEVKAAVVDPADGGEVKTSPRKAAARKTAPGGDA